MSSPRAPPDERRNPKHDPPHEPRQPVAGRPRIHGELLELGIEVSRPQWGDIYFGALKHPPDLAHLSAEPNRSRRRGRHDVRGRVLDAECILIRGLPTP
jgi:hypothetical protein